MSTEHEARQGEDILECLFCGQSIECENIRTMIRQLQDGELEIVAEAIRDHIFVPSFGRKTTVFLCGADVNDKKTGRHKMAKLFEGHRRYELLYPEDLFDDLMAGQGQHSLLLSEEILANSVDCIILLPESPGSFAELGAFASNDRLANKLICVGQKKYAKKKSFINYGPVRLIRASDTGHVLNIAYDDLESRDKKQKLYKRINDAITVIKKEHPIRKNVANIMETENFVLPSIYLIDSITIGGLYKLVQYATRQDKKVAEIATRSSITRLLRNRHIARTAAGFEMTKLGIDRVRSNIKAANLNIARIEIINAQQRRNKMIKAIKF